MHKFMPVAVLALGVFLSFNPSAQANPQNVPCVSLTPSGFPLGLIANPTTPCRLVASTVPPRTPITFHAESELLDNPASWFQAQNGALMYPNFAVSAEEGLRAYGIRRPIHVFFLAQANTTHANENGIYEPILAAPGWGTPADACPVLVFQNRENNGPVLQQVLARALAECWMQDFFPDAGSFQATRRHWFRTGLALALSDFLYPTANYELSRAAFDSYSALRSPVDQQNPLQTYAFFRFLLGVHGANFRTQLAGLAQGVTAAGADTALAQHPALSALPSPLQTLHWFGRALHERRLTDASGLLIRHGAIWNTPLNLTPGGSSHFVPLNNGVSTLIQIKLPRRLNATVRFTLTNADRGNFILTPYLNSETGVYRDAPSGSSVQFLTPCNGEVTLPVLVTALSTDGNRAIPMNVELVSAVSTEEECNRQCTETRLDPCYHGRWQLDPSSMDLFYAQLSDPNIRLRSLLGDLFLDISQDRRMTWTFNAWTHKTEVFLGRSSSSRQPVDVTIAGSVAYRMGSNAVGGRASQVCMDPLEGQLEVTARTWVGGQEMTVPADQIPGLGPSGGSHERMASVCDRDDMTLFYVTNMPRQGEILVPYRFRKVR